MSQITNIRQNFDPAIETEICKQINVELTASYSYLVLSHHYEAVGLKGFHRMYKQFSNEEREHAIKLMKYLNDRGGELMVYDIKVPQQCTFKSGLDSISHSIQLEQNVNKNLLDLHGLASKKGDVHLADFLESQFLDEQVKSIKALSDHEKNLARLGPGMGEYQYDVLTLCSIYKA